MARVLQKLRGVDFYRKIPRRASIPSIAWPADPINDVCRSLCLHTRTAYPHRPFGRSGKGTPRLKVPCTHTVMSCSDLTEATLAGASISLVAAATIVFLLLAVSTPSCLPWSRWVGNDGLVSCMDSVGLLHSHEVHVRNLYTLVNILFNAGIGKLSCAGNQGRARGGPQRTGGAATHQLQHQLPLTVLRICHSRCQ